jgi:hypothetical protein
LIELDPKDGEVDDATMIRNERRVMLMKASRAPPKQTTKTYLTLSPKLKRKTMRNLITIIRMERRT